MSNQHGIYTSYIKENGIYKAIVTTYENGCEIRNQIFPEQFTCDLEALAHGYKYAVDNFSTPDGNVNPDMPVYPPDISILLCDVDLENKKYSEMFTTSQLVAMRFVDFECFLTNDRDIDYGREIILSTIRQIEDRNDIREFMYFIQHSFTSLMVTGFIKTMFLLRDIPIDFLPEESVQFREYGIDSIVTLARKFLNKSDYGFLA